MPGGDLDFHDDQGRRGRLRRRFGDLAESDDEVPRRARWYRKGQREFNPVTKMCAWLVVSTSGCYHWLSRPTSATAARRGVLTAKVHAFFTASDGTQGYGRIHADLADEGTECSPELLERDYTWAGFTYHMRTELVANALTNGAATTIIESGAIFHSVRGSVYTSTD
jgi:putative transposase